MAAAYADRVLALRDGRLSEHEVGSAHSEVADGWRPVSAPLSG
jgi:ABC-type hemin transport system ATPase subunit